VLAAPSSIAVELESSGNGPFANGPLAFSLIVLFSDLDSCENRENQTRKILRLPWCGITGNHSRRHTTTLGKARNSPPRHSAVLIPPNLPSQPIQPDNRFGLFWKWAMAGEKSMTNRCHHEAFRHNNIRQNAEQAGTCQNGVLILQWVFRPADHVNSRDLYSRTRQDLEGFASTFREHDTPIVVAHLDHSQDKKL
jgi:hypothetical protein